ncbi:MAG: hypothetical protein WC462_00845 [archaeon]
MVKAKTVDKKIKASKKGMKKEIRKEKAKNVKQDVEILKLKNDIANLKKKKKISSHHVSEYNLFIRKQIRFGLSFSRAAKEWNKYKALQRKNKRGQSAYNQFIGSQMRLGKTFLQAVALWRLARAGKLGRKGKTKTVTKTVVRTRTIKSKPKIRYRTKTKTVVRRIKSKPKIKYRTKTVVRRVKSKPVSRTRTITRVVRSSPRFDMSALREIISSSSHSSSISKSDLKEALNPDAEEIAFKIVQTYFIEVARLGFKRQLSLDEIINAYFYALARVRRQNIEMSEVDRAVRDSGIKK